jgi:thiamine-phosphate pyrophosphorylase
MNPIGRLHLLTDNALQTRFGHLELARFALEGRADTVQYRRKAGSTLQMLEEASAIREICRRKGVPLIVNDRVDVALAADADGVHLGDQDLPIPLAREILGPHRRIGGSADNAEDALRLEESGADYLGIGPVFPTASKADTGPVLGLDGLARAVRATRIPLIAIGGITRQNLASVLETGVWGAAILSDFCAAENPAEAAAEMRAIIERFPVRTR